MQDKVKFVVVGCGHIGKHHIAVIEKNPHAALVACCDIAEKGSLNLGDNSIPFFESLEGLFDSGIQIDVICIATPNGLHEEQALRVLQAGYHVVIEKPMALSKEGCERILFEALHHHKRVFCVMQNRYSPPAIWMKEIVQQKILGDIYIVQVNCYWNRDSCYYTGKNWHGTKQLDGGTLFTQFSHFIDMLFWLFGDIKNIGGKLHNFNHAGLTDFEDSGFISFDFVNGGSGCLNYSTSVWEENLESSMTIIGQNGTIKISGQYMNEVEYCNIKDYTKPDFIQTNSDNHRFVIEDVINTLRQGKPEETNAAESMQVVDIIGRIYQAVPLSINKTQNAWQED